MILCHFMSCYALRDLSWRWGLPHRRGTRVIIAPSGSPTRFNDGIPRKSFRSRLEHVAARSGDFCYLEYPAAARPGRNSLEAGTMDEDDPREEISDLEAKIEELAETIEHCRKLIVLAKGARSEERRVGKECRSRWSP